MPSSDVHNIAPILHKVCEIQPKSILDLGIGCGKYGALIREYLEVNRGKITPASWEVAIDGVEGFIEYMNPMWDMYSQVKLADYRTMEKKLLSGYDLVLMIDSLEHMERDEGDLFLRFLVEDNKNVIVSVPNGVMEQGAWGGNELERHLATWDVNDFQQRGGRLVHVGTCAVAHFSGVYKCPKPRLV